MAQCMVAIVTYLSAGCRVRHVRISVPLIACLVDGQRYFLPDALPPPEGQELRPMLRPRITTQPQRERAPRAPTLRKLVRWAMECDDAEQLGLRLRKRYQRQQQRRNRLAREAAAAEKLPGEA
jgi:hypothetical protein